MLVDSNGKIVATPKPPAKSNSTLPDDIPRKTSLGVRINQVSLTPSTRIKKEQTGNGHWQFDKEMGTNGCFGFIYLVYDRVNDKYYIGKKQYYGTGKLNKGEPSDWRGYTSSCKALCESIREHGKEFFEFYVLDEYKIRGSLGFAETWSLMYVEAPANRDKWYNMLVNKISWSVKEGISQKHKDRLNLILSKQI